MGAVAAGVIAGISTAGSIAQSRRAQRAQSRAQKVQERINSVRAQRERARLVQEESRLRARFQTQSQAQGTGTASTTLGAQASLQTQGISGLSFLEQVSRGQSQIGRLTQKASSAQSSAAAFGEISSFAFKAESIGLFK